MLLSEQTMLRNNTAPTGGLAHITNGFLAYGLPAALGTWVSGGFTCEPYRVPCGADNSLCAPQIRPFLLTVLYYACVPSDSPRLLAVLVCIHILYSQVRSQREATPSRPAV